jgi:hypothetical protein
MSLDKNSIRNMILQQLKIQPVKSINSIVFELCEQIGFGELNGDYLESLEWPVEITIQNGVFYYTSNNTI